MQKWIDLRSDTVTQPTQQMRDAMYRAQVGDDVYGDDPTMNELERKAAEMLGKEAAMFVASGTMGNAVAVMTHTRRGDEIILSDTAHIVAHEVGGAAVLAQAFIRTLHFENGVFDAEQIRSAIRDRSNIHYPYTGLICVEEPLSTGKVVPLEKLQAVYRMAKEEGLPVHMDGARLSNAVAYLGCSPRALTAEAGIDVLSFGGTKNGMMFGEAVVFFNTSPLAEVPYIRKQAMQLHSKSRFIAVQFSTVLKDGLWLKAAAHANRMAQMLAGEAAKIPGVRITQEVQGNEIFAIIPREKIQALQEKCFFYVWDESASEVRWVCSFDTTESDIIEFVNILREELC